MTGRAIPTYLYHFRTIPARLALAYEHLGVLCVAFRSECMGTRARPLRRHTAEVPFVFNVSALWNDETASEDGKTASTVMRHWASFATSGHPGAPYPSPVAHGSR